MPLSILTNNPDVNNNNESFRKYYSGVLTASSDQAPRASQDALETVKVEKITVMYQLMESLF
jgi:hypothetical protein